MGRRVKYTCSEIHLQNTWVEHVFCVYVCVCVKQNQTEQFPPYTRAQLPTNTYASNRAPRLSMLPQLSP